MKIQHILLPVGLLAGIGLSPVWAQEKIDAETTEQDHQHDKAELPDITVTADPFSGRGHVESLRPTAVIDQESLARSRANTLGASMANQPGVHSADFAAGASRPSIRGQAGPRVRILEGGAAIQDVSTLSPDHNVATEPYGARQVEILKGPASLLYGSGAIGGVVNVVNDLVPDFSPPQTQSELGMQFDSVNDGQSYWGGLETGGEGWAFTLHALDRSSEDYDIPGVAEAHDEIHGDEGEEHHEEGEEHHEEEELIAGRVPNSAVDSQSVRLGLSKVWEQGHLGFGYSRYESDYGIPGHGHAEEEHEEAGHEEGAEEEHHEEEIGAGAMVQMQQDRYELRGLWQPNSGLFERLRGSFVYSDYEHVEIEGEGAHHDEEEEGEAHHEEEEGHAPTQFTSKSSELRLEALHRRIGGWHGVFGLQLEDREFSALGEEAFVPPVDTQSIGLFVVEELDLAEHHRLSVGLRGESVEHVTAVAMNRDFSLLNASVGILLQNSENQHVKVNVSHAERAASEQELYSNGPHLATQSFENGDAALDKERALSVDLSWHWELEDFQIQLDLFHTAYRDFIFASEVDSNSDGEADRVNEEGELEEDGELLVLNYLQEDASFQGYELSLNWQATPITQIGAFTDYVQAERDGGENLPRIPARRVGVSARQDRGTWQYGAQLIHVFEQDEVAALESHTESYQLLSADISYAWALPQGELNLALQGRNLLDEEARNHVSFLKNLAPLPGRSINANLIYRF